MTSPPAEPEISFIERPRDPSNTNVAADDDDDETNSLELDGLGAMFLYEKRYDALQNPTSNLKNELNGTCQNGQLLLRGYAQELHNGQMLRSTYIRGERNPHLSEHLALFDLTSSEDLYSGHNGTRRPYEAPHLYVRSDDEQRTIMSGQVLLRGIFGDLVQKHWDEISKGAVGDDVVVTDFGGTEQDDSMMDPTIVVHTADKWQDIVDPNANVCPRLKDLEKEAEASKEFAKKFLHSEESRMMRKLLSELGGDFGRWDDSQDCMMTAICNDLDLPNLLDDYGRDTGGKESPYGKNLFRRMNDFSYQPYNYMLRYNDAAYSKLAFAPLWVEMLSNILPHLRPEIQKQYNNMGKIKTNDPPPKLAIFSGHDTTLLAILATLGEEMWDGEDWAPYASLMVIELHDIIDSSSAEVVKVYPSGQAFRLVYNGDIITTKMRGCPIDSELCDVTILLNRVLSFATEYRDCESTDDSNAILNVDTLSKSPVDDAIMALFATWKGICVFLFTVLVSGCIGCVITFVMLTGRFPNFWSCSKRRSSLRYGEAAGDELNAGEVGTSYGTTTRNKDVRIT
eukprot:CAMPEP_0198255998 /NCGR_PEP_ID=MMETSP1447-20131203/6000_1 /TAXON_ID=420782 /ORGANISM="Chaetoceros dichaeta, Strain CCMP1751" /LENGTH=566 /DNA_ID=CAMNT_0043942521 /DNA_START=367 /DNA_END=2067 /DNA_ORIENTATION=-